MEDERRRRIRLTVDEIDRDRDNVELATLVSDSGHEVIIPLELLPDGTRIGDVLTADLSLDPHERERRRTWISDLQRRLFESG